MNVATPEEKQHSILSPSGADGWTACVGKLAAAKGVKVTRSSEAAAKGTAKHAISEYILRGDYPTRGCGSQVGSNVEADGFTFEVDDEFADHVDTYVNYVNSRPGRKMYEQWLSTSYIFGVREGQGGTADCLHLDYQNAEIEVIDAKFGYVPVSAKHKQLRIYGAAALALFDFEGEWKTVRTTIVQPQDVGEPVKTHVYTREEIEAFVKEIAPTAQLALRLYDNPPVDLHAYLTPTPEACAWCPIAGQCTARAERVANLFSVVTEESPDVVLLTNERLAELYAQTEDIVEWAKSIAAEAESRALTGGKMPGYKLIYGRKGRRQYKADSHDSVKSVLEMVLGPEDMYLPQKLVSPTQAEEALKKAKAPALYAQIAPFIEQADPKLRLVPESTKGDAVIIDPISFQDVSA